MKFLKFKNMAMIGALSIAGVGLIGVGAHATFTSDAAATQTITAGTLSISVGGYAGTPTVYSGQGCSDGTCTTTLAPVVNVPSNFTTGLETIVITNSGSLPATVSSFSVTNADTTAPADIAFANEANLCAQPSTTALTGFTSGSGNFSIATTIGNLNEAGPPALGTTTVAPNGGTLFLYVEVYAGTANTPTNCGTQADTYPNGLNNDAQGGSAALSMTIGFTA